MTNEEIKTEATEVVHKRRKRYSGTHPRKFSEKYKELNPEKYADDVAHIISRGATPAGMHISIMVNEILEFLDIKPGQIGLDATLGYGGHTKAMLQKLDGQGHIYALDVDPIESAKTKERLNKAGFGDDILTVRLQNFKDIDKVVADTGKSLTLFLQTLVSALCRLTTPSVAFHTRLTAPLTCALTHTPVLRAHKGFYS